MNNFRKLENTHNPHNKTANSGLCHSVTSRTYCSDKIKYTQSEIWRG